MHIPRPNFPDREICRHITMALAVLARHMELQPHLFRVQLDHAAVLPVTTVLKLRDDFAQSLHLTPQPQRNPNQAFFFAEERHTMVTALLALNEYREYIGDRLVAEEMAPLLCETAPALLSPPKLHMLAHLTLTQLPDFQGASPHRGNQYEHLAVTFDTPTRSHQEPCGEPPTASL